MTGDLSCFAPKAIIPSSLPRSIRIGQPPDPVPCLLLGQLATDENWIGQGIGPGLVKHALQRCVTAAGLIGGRALIVNAVDDEAAAFCEQERIDLVMAYHRRARIRLPQEKVHAVFHVIVESQIADPKRPVRSTAQRLMSEGLDRHEAIHAIGSVLAGHMNELMPETKSGDDDFDAKPNRDPNEAHSPSWN